ncbi:MAG: hypothetical protein ACK5KN_02625 [Dysgonomonas sp.]|uniref:hypothetical protein n=1 Tax=Dysgonomonas sp. TaxID=1891233 RepID=UPI003A859FB7
MADFDNGLPPVGTDVTDNSVSSVNISSSDAAGVDIKDINSVNVSNSDADVLSVRKVSGLFISNEISGSNWGTML